MYTQDMIEACPLIAVGEFIYKLRPVKRMQRDDNHNWQEVEVLEHVGVPVAKATFQSEEVARFIAEACNSYAKHLKGGA